MKKITLEDFVKLGFKLTPHKLKDDEETKAMITDCLKKQEEIMKMAKVDWNNPQLRRPMDI